MLPFAYWRLLLLLPLLPVLLIAPFILQPLAALSPKPKRLIAVIIYRYVLFVINIRVKVSGTVPKQGLLVANHRSWTDIPVLGACANADFVAKHEVRSWPLIGRAAAALGTVFVNRNQPRQAAGQRDALAAALQTGKNVVLFAEGTSHGDAKLLPFKSTLLAAVPENATVVPTAIEYRLCNGLATGRRLRHDEAWSGDQTFAEHLLRRLRSGRLEVCVHFSPPLTSGGDRKALAKQCRDEVQAALCALHESGSVC